MKKFFLMLTAIMLTACAAKASGIPFTDYRTLSVSDGLPSNTIGAIRKDSLGFIWIGTKQGLCRFDGCDIKNYPILSGEDIWAIEELDNDTLLIGSLTGLTCFSRYSNTTTKISIPPTIVKAIQKTGKNIYLAGTESGLYAVKNHKPHPILLGTGLSPCNHITSIIREDRNIYWFSTADGLGRIDMRTMKPIIYRMEENLSNSNFFTCLTRIRNYIYLGSFNKGIFRFDMSDKKFTKIPGFEHNLIMTISGQDDQLFIGTNGQGLKTMSIKNGQVTISSHNEKERNSISSNTVTAFLYDKDICWVGTQFGGICYTPRSDSKFSFFSQNGFYSSDYRVRSFYISTEGNKFIGTRTGLFFVEKKNGKVYSYNTKNSSLRSDIILFIRSINGKILIATYGGGIHMFNEKTRTLEDLSDEEFFLYGCIFHFTQDKNKNLWFASQSGLYQTTPDGHVLKRYDTMNSILPTNAVYQLHFDMRNRLWTGTKFGLLLLDTQSGKMRSDCFEEPIRGEVKYIMEDSRNDIWVCTDKGLYVIDESNLSIKHHFTAENILPSNSVQSVKEDKKKNYWIATLNGIVYYNPQNGKHHTYQKQDGIGEQDFNNDVFLSSDSTVWWANEGGLVYTSEKDLHSWLPLTNNPTLTSCFAGEQEYDCPYRLTSKEIALSPEENNIRFTFSNMNYALPYANVYEFKLEGYDKKWRIQSGENEVSYKNLPGGHYMFKLRIPGTNEETVHANIHVKKSYTFTAVVCTSFALIAILAAYFFHLIGKLKKRMHKGWQVLNNARERQSSKNILPDTRVDELMNSLLAYMEKKKPYLNPKLNIGEVAAKLGCTEMELSQLLNNNMKINFSNFINTYRINEIQERMTQENLSRYTLKALSEQCGFSSKTTFYRVFKNVTGMTPSEYCKKKNLTVKDN